MPVDVPFVDGALDALPVQQPRGLLRMWAEFEDRIVEQLAAEAGGPATPALRLRAIQLVGIVRTTTAPELRDSPSGLADWLREAPDLVEG